MCESGIAKAMVEIKAMIPNTECQAQAILKHLNMYYKS